MKKSGKKKLVVENFPTVIFYWKFTDCTSRLAILSSDSLPFWDENFYALLPGSKQRYHRHDATSTTTTTTHIYKFHTCELYIDSML